MLKLNITNSDNIVILATQHNNIIQRLFRFFITIQIALVVLLGHISLFHKKSHIAFLSSPWAFQLNYLPQHTLWKKIHKDSNFRGTTACHCDSTFKGTSLHFISHKVYDTSCRTPYSTILAFFSSDNAVIAVLCIKRRAGMIQFPYQSKFLNRIALIRHCAVSV